MTLPEALLQLCHWDIFSSMVKLLSRLFFQLYLLQLLTLQEINLYPCPQYVQFPQATKQPKLLCCFHLVLLNVSLPKFRKLLQFFCVEESNDPKLDKRNRQLMF